MKRLREIIRKIDQGVTEAVLCRAEDGVNYVVKTRLSGSDALVKEWLGYKIGTRLGLPIPEAQIVYMETKLADCPGFGSALVEPTDLLTVDQVPDVLPAERAMVLLFDWWIVNGDRQDGNPNLLWLQYDKKLHVIDHNLAFGEDAPDEFWARHLFRNDRLAMSALRAQMLPVMTDIIGRLPVLWQDLQA